MPIFAMNISPVPSSFLSLPMNVPLLEYLIADDTAEAARFGQSADSCRLSKKYLVTSEIGGPRDGFLRAATVTVIVVSAAVTVTQDHCHSAPAVAIGVAASTIVALLSRLAISYSRYTDAA